MVRSLALAFVVGLLLTTASGCGTGDTPAGAPEHLDLAVTSHGEAEVRWERSWDQALQRARTEGKPVLVNFYADWCVWCKHLDTITFRDQKVAALLADRVVPLSIDIDGDAQHLVRELRIEAPPTIVLLDTSGAEIGRIPGYMPPSGFLSTVQRMLDSSAPGDVG